MEVHASAMKGMRKLDDLSYGIGELKPPLNCLVKLDYEEVDLIIWEKAAERRGGFYHHIRNAPKLLRDLNAWLEKVDCFKRLIKLQCSNYADVRAMVGPAWVGRSTSKAPLAFQAVANSTGIMHPPRKDYVIPSWRMHAAFTGRTVMGAHLRRGVTPLTLLPSPNIAKETADLEGSLVATNISKVDPLPPSTPAALGICSRGTQVIRLYTNAGGVLGAPGPVDNVINEARPSLPFGSNLRVPTPTAIGGDTSHTPPQRHLDHVAAQPGIRGILGAECPGPSIPRRRLNAAGQNPASVIVLFDDSDSDGGRKSTSVVHGSVNSKI